MKKNLFFAFSLLTVTILLNRQSSLADTNKVINTQNVVKNKKINNAKGVKKVKIIGVIGDRLTNKDNEHNYTHWPIYAIRYQYIDNFASICKDNNVAFILLPDDLSQVDKFSSVIDGLLLTGGGDDPTGIRDKFEEAMFINAMKNNKQIFGICRGMQMINYFLGGDIVKLSDIIKTK